MHLWSLKRRNILRTWFDLDEFSAKYEPPPNIPTSEDTRASKPCCFSVSAVVTSVPCRCKAMPMKPKERRQSALPRGHDRTRNKEGKEDCLMRMDARERGSARSHSARASRSPGSSQSGSDECGATHSRRSVPGRRCHILRAWPLSDARSPATAVGSGCGRRVPEGSSSGPRPTLCIHTERDTQRGTHTHACAQNTRELSGRWHRRAFCASMCTA